MLTYHERLLVRQVEEIRAYERNQREKLGLSTYMPLADRAGMPALTDRSLEWRWREMFNVAGSTDQSLLRDYLRVSSTLDQSLPAETRRAESEIRSVLLGSLADYLNGSAAVTAAEARLCETSLKHHRMCTTYDRAAFCVGSFVNAAPAAVSRMKCAPNVISGMCAGAEYGWPIGQGVAKFCANGLVVLATWKHAATDARSAAMHALLITMHKWLMDPYDPPEDGIEVADCNCEAPALAATCFLERAFVRAGKLVTEVTLAYDKLAQLTMSMLEVTQEKGGNPFCVSHILRMKGGAARLASLPDSEEALGGWVQGVPLVHAIALSTCMLDTLDDRGSKREVMLAFDRVLDTARDQGEERRWHGWSQEADDCSAHAFGSYLLLSNFASVPLLTTLCKLASESELAVKLLSKVATSRVGYLCLCLVARKFRTGDSETETAATHARAADLDAQEDFLDGFHVDRTWDSYEMDDFDADSELMPLLGRSLHSTDPADEPYGPPWLTWRKQTRDLPTALEATKRHFESAGAANGAEVLVRNWPGPAPCPRADAGTPGESDAAASSSSANGTRSGNGSATQWPGSVGAPDLATAYTVMQVLAEAAAKMGLAEEERRVEAEMSELIGGMTLREKRVWLWRQIRTPWAGGDRVDGDGPSSPVSEGEDELIPPGFADANAGAGRQAPSGHARRAPRGRHRRRATTTNDLADTDADSDYSSDGDESDTSEGFTFIECDRSSVRTTIEGLLGQMHEGIGVAGNPLVDLEVAFTGESSAGSAVVREWLTVATKALLSAEAGIFASLDGGRTFRPSAAAFPHVALEEEHERLEALRAAISEATTTGGDDGGREEAADALWDDAFDPSEGPEFRASEGAESTTSAPAPAAGSGSTAVSFESIMVNTLGLFEIQGRVLGFALAHQEYIPLRLCPMWAKLILRDGQPWEPSDDEVKTFDADFARAKVNFLRNNDIDELYLGLDWTDAVEDRQAEAAEAEDPEGAEEGSDASDGSSISDGSEALDDGEIDAAARALVRARCASRVPLPPPSGASNTFHLSYYVNFFRALADQGCCLDRDALDEVRSLAEDCEVSEANKDEYLKRVIEYRMFTSVEAASRAFLRGLHVAVPPEVLRRLAEVVSPQDFCDIISGMGDIDVDDWEANTKYQGALHESHEAVKWFWSIVRDDLHDEQRRQLLAFATGSSLVPLGGFGALRGFAGGTHVFTLCDSPASAAPDLQLPRAHACICTLDLPMYTSRQVMAQKLVTAIEFGSAGFDEGAVAGAGGISDDE